eukprot:CAMPEP_0178457020 /NCGR_PEP_ID=MMETSP0689_2-20121128/46795_1 /TAXON_ID=160604 /ORGANISM="Amphidinium massartii, Strain CS-259" /LENGTH=336 /DNA_ID=CAMNT_0020083245 /DNA_START=175 /DNA_END=1185 /DNA_ORIENTATION=-
MSSGTPHMPAAPARRGGSGPQVDIDDDMVIQPPDVKMVVEGPKETQLPDPVPTPPEPDREGPRPAGTEQKHATDISHYVDHPHRRHRPKSAREPAQGHPPAKPKPKVQDHRGEGSALKKKMPCVPPSGWDRCLPPPHPPDPYPLPEQKLLQAQLAGAGQQRQSAEILTSERRARNELTRRACRPNDEEVKRREQRYKRAKEEGDQQAKEEILSEELFTREICEQRMKDIDDQHKLREDFMRDTRHAPITGGGGWKRTTPLFMPEPSTNREAQRKLATHQWRQFLTGLQPDDRTHLLSARPDSFAGYNGPAEPNVQSMPPADIGFGYGEPGTPISTR